MHALMLATGCLIDPHDRLLLVRKRGSTIWMLPGGKIDGPESARQALLRELREELQWDGSETEWTLLGHFSNRAANEANTQVQAQVFHARLADTPAVQIAAEIAAMQWWPLAAPMDAGFAPLLREMVRPALLRLPPRRA